MKVLTRLFLSLALIVSMFSNAVFAAGIGNDKTQDLKGTDITSNENIKLITADQYYEMIANARNISINDAKKLTKQIIKEHQLNLKKEGKIPQDAEITPQIIGWGSSWSDGYGGNYYNAVVYTDYNAGGGMYVEVGVPAVIYIYGSYAREFVSIDSAACYAQPLTSGKYTYNAFTKTASLVDNQVHLNSRGNVEITSQSAADLGFSVADLINFGFSYSSSYTYRKTIDISCVQSLY